MIGALRGTVAEIKKNPVIVFVGDVGYAVHIPDQFAKTLSVDQKTMFYIHTHVREDALDLFGFQTQEDLALFELLLTVSGIGPKTALAVCDRGATAIQHAVQESDVDFFTTVPRLGKKNAQKIIIELKNKLGSIHDLDLRDDRTTETDELIDTLLSMGFVKKEIQKIMTKLPKQDMTLEDKLRDSLKLLGK